VILGLWLAVMSATVSLAMTVLVPLGGGWNLPRSRVARSAPVVPIGRQGRDMPYGMHGSGPAFAAENAVPPGVTAPSSINSFNLTFQGGEIQPTTTSYVIYWDPHATIDRKYEKLIDRFLGDSGRSVLYQTLTQYSGSNGRIKAKSTFGGSLVDKDPFPKQFTRATILAEVSNVLGQFDFTPGIGDEVFLAFPHGALPADGYCAYHGGVTYQSSEFALALIPYADAPGCGEEYDFLSPNRDIVADSGVVEVWMAQAGMITDPLLDAWYDEKNGEVQDLCFEDFGDGVDGRGANLIVSDKHGTVDEYEVPEVYSLATLGCGPSL